MSTLRVNPYVGLRPFFAEDSLYFFGREQQTAELLEILHQHRFLGVVGSSGSGKSSLVRAGLLPALLAGFLVEERDHWRTVQIKPGDAPLANLATGLVEVMNEQATAADAENLEQEIREGHTDAVIDFLAPLMNSDDNLFLLVDQFEEIFAFRGASEEDEAHKKLSPMRLRDRARRKAEADDFIDLLIALGAQRELPIYVTLTMRTDFLGDCDLFYGLPEALNQGRYLVPRMTRQQMRDAIECPAILKHVKMAPRLLDHVLNEVGDRFDRLPVLQHALLRTWDAWQAAGGLGQVELRHFEAAGGLEHALDQDAENALQGLDIEVTSRIFKRLTETDNSQRRVRSPARISELVKASGADRDTVEEVVTRFEEDGRSFVHGSPDGKPDDPRVDISHESLIRQWDRLRNWVDEECRSRDRYIELVARAREWQHGDAALLWPPGLHVAMDWKKEANPSPGWAKRYAVAADDYACATEFLDQSIGERCKYLTENELQRRWQKIWNPLIIAAVVMAGIVTEQSDIFEANLEPAEPTTVSTPQNGPDLENPAESAWETVDGTGTVDDTGAVDVTSAVDVIDAVEDTGNGVKGQLGESFGKLEQVGESTFRKYWYLTLFVVIYFALRAGGRRFHRRFAFPKILQHFVASDGRVQIERIANTRTPKDAVVVHQTTYASAIRRIGGYVLDYFVFLLAAIPAILAVGAAYENMFSSSDVPIIALLIFLVIFAWSYQALQIASKRQATLGMRAVGIFRTDLQGERLSLGRASAWWLSRWLSYLLYFAGFVSQTFTKKRQTLHDWMARTVVLRRLPPDAAPNLKPVMPRTVVAKIVIVTCWVVVYAIFFSAIF